MKFNTNISLQELIYLLIAIGVVIISCFQPFVSAQTWLRELASLIIGGIFVTKPNDVNLNSMLKIVTASKFPPPNPPPNDLG
jgi:hypothetical protein